MSELNRLAALRRKRTEIGKFASVKWSEADEENFRSLFPITSNRELSKIFGLAEGTIAIWGSQRKLRKVPGGTGRSLPLGTRRIDVYGYNIIKTKEGGGGKAWERLHVVMWREANGEIPDGYRVRFKDGNKENCVLENLEMVSNQDHMKTNTIANYPKELKQAMIVLSKLRKVIHEKQD